MAVLMKPEIVSIPSNGASTEPGLCGQRELSSSDGECSKPHTVKLCLTLPQSGCPAIPLPKEKLPEKCLGQTLFQLW